MSPTPIPIHQIIAGELYSVLREACPKHLRVFGSPIDYQPTPVPFPVTITPSVLLDRD